jgi:hypothetical protein
MAAREPSAGSTPVKRPGSQQRRSPLSPPNGVSRLPDSAPQKYHPLQSPWQARLLEKPIDDKISVIEFSSSENVPWPHRAFLLGRPAGDVAYLSRTTRHTQFSRGSIFVPSSPIVERIEATQSHADSSTLTALEARSRPSND